MSVDRPAPSHGLDDKTAALARVAVLVALHASPESYRRGVAAALAAAATMDEVVDTLRVVASDVGLARVVSAAPGMALAAGCDLDRAFEGLDDRRRGEERWTAPG